MKFMLLLFQDPSAFEFDETQMSEEDQAAATEPYTEFMKWCGENGVSVLAGEGLLPPMTAKTMRKSGDKVTVTEGPFPELREQLGGFYLIECASMEIAMKAAEKCPMGVGTEVRPVMEL